MFSWPSISTVSLCSGLIACKISSRKSLPRENPWGEVVRVEKKGWWEKTVRDKIGGKQDKRNRVKRQIKVFQENRGRIFSTGIKYHIQCLRTIKAWVRPEHVCTWTWLNVALECVIGASQNRPLEPVQVNKIGIRWEQATLKGWGVGGRLWSGLEYSPDTSEIFIWIMCRFTPEWAEKCTVGGKMTGFNFQLYSEGCSESEGGRKRRERQGN